MRGLAVSAITLALLISQAGCAALRTNPTVQSMMTASRAGALGLKLIEFIESEGGPQDMADDALAALKEKDYGKALATCYMGVEDMRADGVPIPESISRTLFVVRSAMAAQSFDDLAKDDEVVDD